MSTEIERKFLVAGEAWRRPGLKSVALRDGLIAMSDHRKVRVRIFPDGATLTVKGRREQRTRTEYEYTIPLADGLAMLSGMCGADVISKTRYFVPHERHEWVVDVYHEALDGIVIAELELSSADEAFSPPPWLGREVTDEPAYRKINLLNARRRAGAPPLPRAA